MKVIHCEDGVLIEGRNYDELAANAQAHIVEAHSDLLGKLSRQDILNMAQEVKSKAS